VPRSLRLYQVNAFTARPFAGNPAAVVPDARGLSDAEMQAIARELNLSETAFALPGHDPAQIRVRFFTPTAEVPSCGHATIATHFVRAEERPAAGPIVQLTAAGPIGVTFEPRPDGRRRVWMRQRPATFEKVLDAGEAASLLAALDVTADDVLPLPMQVVSTGHSKVMIPLRRRERLRALRPSARALCDLSARIGCNGYFAFTLDAPDPGRLAHGRMFAPAIGIPEDPVTGNANGPMGAYLLRYGLAAGDANGTLSFTAGQGDELGRPGLAHVRVEAADGTLDVSVGGDAVVVWRGELRL
jgi:PhzF family phenazine biosynthesis protein